MNIPGYQIESELGRGGMATVYLAEQLSLGRKVALKVMAPALAADAGFGERFLREARTAASLSHPGIMSVYDVGVDGHSYYIAMEYIPGGDLKQKLRHANLAPETALQITSNVAAALGHAHTKGFVHRDVKPENILFREDGTPVLADFGIAKATGSGTKMTGTGMSIGTPHYMSPEQARGQQVDGRSDLYSLGVVFYEMLTGQVPFEAEDSFAVAYAHINNPIPPLPSTLSHIQPLLERMLAKNPTDRYSTAASLITDIDKLTQGKPLPAAATPKTSQPQAPQRTQVMSSSADQSKGSSAVTWLLAGAFLALLAAGGFWFWQQQSSPRLVNSGGSHSAPVEPAKQSRPEPVTQNRQTVAHKPPQLTPERQKQQKIKELLQAAEEDLTALRLTKPSGNNALEKYRAVQQLDPDNSQAKSGLAELVEKYVTLSDQALSRKEFIKARSYLTTARQILPNNWNLQQGEQRLAAAVKAEGQRQIALAEKQKKREAAAHQAELDKQQLVEQQRQAARQIEIQRQAALEEQRRNEEISRRPATYTDPITGMKFVLVKGGCFEMGQSISEKRYLINDLGQATYDDNFANSAPHKVCIDDIYVGKYEVTQYQWLKVMKDNPSDQKSLKHPVEWVSWEDVQGFLQRLRKLGAKDYRLPTEAEWEYSARAGTVSPFAFGDTISTDLANYAGIFAYGIGHKGVYRKKTTAAGNFPANKFGLHDMHGNVWEWCSDWYSEEYYMNSPIYNPRGPLSGSERVIRGGAFSSHPAAISSSFRGSALPSKRKADLGFRLVFLP